MNIKEFAHKILGMPFVEKGRDYTGGDCWAVPYLAYKDVKGVLINDYVSEYIDTGATSETKNLLADLIKNESKKVDVWEEVPTEDRQPLDVVLFEIGNQALHCGVMIDKKFFIHNRPRVGVVVERITDLRWFDRIDGFYRPVINGGGNGK